MLVYFLPLLLFVVMVLYLRNKSKEGMLDPIYDIYDQPNPTGCNIITNGNISGTASAGWGARENMPATQSTGIAGNSCYQFAYGDRANPYDYDDGGQAKCKPNIPKLYINSGPKAGSVFCGARCPNNYFKDPNRATNCLKCPDGSTSTNGIKCCPIGYIPTSDNNQCKKVCSANEMQSGLECVSKNPENDPSMCASKGPVYSFSSNQPEGSRCALKEGTAKKTSKCVCPAGSTSGTYEYDCSYDATIGKCNPVTTAPEACNCAQNAVSTTNCKCLSTTKKDGGAGYNNVKCINGLYGGTTCAPQLAIDENNLTEPQKCTACVSCEAGKKRIDIEGGYECCKVGEWTHKKEGGCFPDKSEEIGFLDRYINFLGNHKKVA